MGGHEEEGADVDYSGLALADELLLGGTVSEGLVIGGGLLDAWSPDTTVEIEGEEVDGIDVSTTLHFIGPFLQYYPDPTSGFHVQVGAGMAWGDRTVEDADGFDGSSDGFGLIGGLGIDSWIGDEWSIGGHFRILYASLEEDGAEGSGFVPSANLTFTYH